MSETMAAVGQYCLQRVSFAEADPVTLAEWESFSSRHSAESPQQDPVWLRGFFAGQLHNLNAYFLYQSGELCGVAPFLLKDWPLKWHLGEVAIAQPRLRRLRLLSGRLNFPEDEAAYDILFAELAKSENTFDAVHMEEVPLVSFLWKYLQTSPLIRRQFRMYVPDAPTPHLELRFRGSFDQYMKKFSAKHRHNLRREVKRIEQGILGPMRFERYVSPEDVSRFLDSAVQISKKTYQWQLHQRGLSGTDLLRNRLLFAAEHGWLRSYMLFCNDIPCAFLAGFQYRGTFLLLEIGFDPTLSKYSVGTVLQLLAIEDLFAQDAPAVLDFASYGGWKQAFSTDSYQEVKILLFRPGAYTRFVQVGHHFCQVVTTRVGATLERLHLKTWLKKTIRGFSTKNQTAPNQPTENPGADE